MAWVMSVLGAALALGGGYVLWTGSGYIRLDWGQAETVAGTVALSAGILTIGLAAVLFALRGLARPAPPAVAATPGAGAAPIVPAGERGVPAVPSPAVPAARAAAPVTRASERIEPAPPPAPERAVAGPDLDEPFTGSHPLAEAAPVPEAPVPAMLAEAPTVVGRYEANGASYVLFSDGTIEVETENGTHRFDSMAHLRDHIQRQDAG